MCNIARRGCTGRWYCGGASGETGEPVMLLASPHFTEGAPRRL